MRDKLNEKKTIKRVGTLYDGLRIHSLTNKHESPIKKIVFLHSPIFMLRRSLFIIITVVLFDYPYLQMAAHQFLSLI